MSKTELQNIIWTELFRPTKLDDLILEDKALIIKYLENPKAVPSFLFYSSKPGTGKTSTAKIIAKHLGSDLLMINSSDERGIDMIREKVKLFAGSMSTKEGVKRCIFLDEIDGLCLDENTNILVYQENILKSISIKELDQKDILVVGYDNESGKLVLTDAFVFNSGEKEMFEIELENGTKIIASEEHPYFQSLDMKTVFSKKIKELCEGDEIINFDKQEYNQELFKL